MFVLLLCEIAGNSANDSLILRDSAFCGQEWSNSQLVLTGSFVMQQKKKKNLYIFKFLPKLSVCASQIQIIHIPILSRTPFKQNKYSRLKSLAKAALMQSFSHWVMQDRKKLKWTSGHKSKRLRQFKWHGNEKQTTNDTPLLPVLVYHFKSIISWKTWLSCF